MTRKLALVLAASLGLWHSAAFALGLGEINVESALNQPFEAEIELRNTDSLARNEILANLASVEDFERVGVERFFFLSDLNFTTDLSDPARPVVRVSSNQPITEPFVNFVVEVLWPSGRLLKEFTVLLDPPTYAARPLAPPRAPGAGSAAPAPTPAPAAPTQVSVAPTREGPGVGTFSGSTYGVTDRNDTLWNIALKVRPERGLSAQQTMLALLRMNPEAFIGGNINQLKAGYVLRVPTAEEISRLSFDDAVVQVSEQNDRWRGGLDRAPLDARQDVAEVRGSGGSSGELRVVSGAQERAPTSATGSGAGAATAAADAAALAQLAAVQSRLADERQQSTELRTQLDGTSARLEEMQRQVELKDEQLARLQQAMAEQIQNPAPVAPAATPAASAGTAGGLFGFSWMIIGAMAAGALVLVAGVLFLLKRLGSRDDSDDFDADEIEEEVQKTQLMPAITSADLDAGDSAPGEGAGDGEDAIGEADVYIAYGRFSEAARVLTAATESEPNRADIRLKLMEVCVEQGDVDAFNEQAFALQGFADEAAIAQADAMATRLPGAASSSGEITSDDAAAGAAAREVAEGEVSLDFDLAAADDGAPADLDGLDIDLDLGDGDGDAAGQDEGELDASIDFDLDLDGDDDAAAEADDDLGLDLDGDDLDLGATLGGDDALDLDTAAADSGDAADEEFSLSLDEDDAADDGDLPDLDFDLGPDDDEVAAAPVAEPDLDDDLAELAEASGDDEDDDDKGDIEFEIDMLDDDADAGDLTALAEPEAELDEDEDDEAFDRTVIMGGDDLEKALEEEVGAGDFEFEIDDLGGDDADQAPAAELASAAPAALDDDDPDRTELMPVEADGALDADLDFELDEDFDFGGEEAGDEISTKLELARAYVDMGDEDGAREILDEVARDGDDGQKQEADDLLAKIG